MSEDAMCSSYENEIARLQAALAEAERKLKHEAEQTEIVLTSYATENQQLSDRAERAETALAGARAQCKADIAAMQREITHAKRASIKIAELEEELHHLYGVEQRAERAEANLAAAREPYRNVDEKDWVRLHLLLGHSGHGQFWKAVLKEVRAFLDRTATANEPHNEPQGL